MSSPSRFRATTSKSKNMVDQDGRSASSSRQQWVCPSDRQLALRAKLQTGWSVKSLTLDTFPSRKQPSPLNKTEQEIIVAVIKRAEIMDRLEQERIGNLKEKLDRMRRNAVGTESNQCVLCGARCIFFGMRIASSIICQDCRKIVCQKCGVDTSSTSARRESVWRCKICAESREVWKKSGAWFFKAFPVHILSTKKTLPQESKHSGSRRPAYAVASTSKTPEFEEDSSSDEDNRASRMLALRTKKPVQYSSSSTSSSQQTSLWRNTMSSSFEKKSSGAHFSSCGPVNGDSVYSFGNRKSDASKKGLQSHKYEMSESSESSTSMKVSKQSQYNRAQSFSDTQSYYKLSLPRDHSSISYNGDQSSKSDNYNMTRSQFNYSRQDSQVSIGTSRDGWSESDRASCSSSSASGYQAGNNAMDDSIDHMAESNYSGRMGTLGTLEVMLIYDSIASSIHISLQRAKNLKPMDINGLADPFCKLNLLPTGTKSHRLRTRTVHKTRNPEFNEELTFYGVTETDLATRALHIIVFDDDKYGYDFMGEIRFLLNRLRPDTARQLNFFLEKHYPVENEEFVWGEESVSHGQILITLCFSTKRKALLVGIARCTNLTPMDNNGFSDPFVKLYLKPDPLHKKYKTSIKWKNLNPIFNEEFVFETKLTDLSHQTLVVTVWDKDYGKSNDYLGCLELGCMSKGERLRQWVDMIKFPDHKHEGWHNLCNEPPPEY